MDASDIYFAIHTPLGITIRTTREYWQIITTKKHPSIAKYKKKVQNALSDPNEIRRSTKDKRIHLYYKNIGNLYICVVADHISRLEGYIITAYLTDRIKEGEKIYVKNKDLL